MYEDGAHHCSPSLEQDKESAVRDGSRPLGFLFGRAMWAGGRPEGVIGLLIVGGAPPSPWLYVDCYGGQPSTIPAPILTA